jgi:hypothetical protein
VWRFITLLLSVAAFTAALAAPAAASSIEFEYLLGTDVQLQQLECNPTGTSSATLSVTGIAGGPHPGTFKSTITLTAGPINFGEGPLVEVNESFEIVSDETVITGTKHLIPTQESFYPFICSVTQSAECEEVSLSASAPDDALRYEATITGPEGSRQENGYAELRVNADGFMCGGEMQFSSGYFEQFFTAALPAQQPATVTLSPAAASNPVDSFHEVMATVLDETNQPVAGAIVRFAVTGASSASAECTTDGNGECTFSYQVAPFPGEDAISAYVDVNANGMQDANEPVGAATNTVVLPASTPGRTTGDGKFLDNRSGEVTFTLSARSDGSTLRGSCKIVDKASDTTIKCLDVLSYRQFENNTRIYGHAEQNGLATIYQIEITDNGPPGSSPADSITVSTAAGYFAFGSVTNGDIQVR